MRCILLWLLLTTLCSCVSLAVTSGTPQPLAPFNYINGQLIDLDTEVKLYRFIGLKPNTGYEVRVSFPASIPASIKFAIVGPPGAAEGQSGSFLGRLGRRLLDCEKLIFSTDEQGAVQGIPDPHLELRAFRRSVHRDGPKAGAPKLVYNIVLAELIGGLPLDSIPTVITIVLVVLVALVWSLIWSNRIFPKLLDYLTSDSSSSKAVAAVDTRISNPSPAAAAAMGLTAGARKATSRSHSKRSA